MTETPVYPPKDPITDQQYVDALVQANRDRGFLARLRRLGKVRRQDGAYELAHPEVARPFVRDIEARAKPPTNLAIRPKAKPKKRRR